MPTTIAKADNNLIFSGADESPEEIISMCIMHGWRLIFCEDIGRYLPVSASQLEKYSSFAVLGEHGKETELIYYMKPTALANFNHGEE